MSIDLRSRALLDLVDAEAGVERIATGYRFTEGPLWNRGGYLLFSDIPGNAIHRWEPGKGASVFRSPSGKSNGLAYDREGRLIACEHANRRVSRTDERGAVTAIASRYDGRRLNSPNDVVVKTDGSIYFTDPPYGLTAEYGEPGEQELDFQGVYRLPSGGGEIECIARDFDRPNGLCFSLDESLLYINDTARMHVRVFDVLPDGPLGRSRIFAEERGEGGAPDGMKLDERGNVWVTGPGGIWVFSARGEHLGVIRIPEMASNLTWGGDDGRTLFVTASTSVYRVPLRVRGALHG